MTVRDLIRRSMRLIGALSAGENPTSEEQSDAFTALNAMLGSWSISGLLVYTVTEETLSFVANQQSYTIGSGGNFNTTRPVKIMKANVLDGDTEYPIDVVNYQQWSSIPVKSNTSNIPNKVYLEVAVPLATLSFYPIPSTANSLILYSLKPLSSFTSVNDSFLFPEGYEDAVVYNLAKRIAPEYGKPLDPSIETIAIETKLQIQRNSSKETLMVSDLFALSPSGFNIYEGVT
jgi:hypothetical protein